jgi:hypothetical protein
MQIERLASPHSRTPDSIWDVVEYAASQLPDWVFVPPVVAKTIHTVIEGQQVVIYVRASDQEPPTSFERKAATSP